MGRGVTGKLTKSLRMGPANNMSDVIQSVYGNSVGISKLQAYLKTTKQIKRWEWVDTYQLIDVIMYVRVASSRRPNYILTIDVSKDRSIVEMLLTM